MKNLIGFAFFAIMWFQAFGQEYILFEQDNNLLPKSASNFHNLLRNEVKLKSGDTALHIFNFYFTPSKRLLESLTKPSNDAQYSDVLITLVPLIAIGKELQLEKLTLDSMKALRFISSQELLSRTVTDLNRSAQESAENILPLKTLSYGLVLKRGIDYYKVTQAVLLSQFTLDNRLWYFPNEFKNGVLNVNPKTKYYSANQLDKIKEEMKFSGAWLNNIFNHVYRSYSNFIPGLKAPILRYFEYPGDINITYYNQKVLKVDNLGLGSFSFLSKIGIINCSLDYYLRKKVLVDQIPQLKIISINNIKFEDFKKVYNNSFPDLSLQKESVNIKPF